MVQPPPPEPNPPPPSTKPPKPWPLSWVLIAILAYAAFQVAYFLRYGG